MKRGKYCLRSLILTFLLTISFIVTSNTASATSDYDEVISVVDSLKVTNGVGTTLDISNRWKNILTDDAIPFLGNRTAFRSAFAAALSSGTGWAVAQVNVLYATPDEYAVRVFVQSEGGSASEGVFNTTCLESNIPVFCMTNAISATIYYAGGGGSQIGVDYSTSVFTRPVAWSSPSPTVTQEIFVARIPLLLPAGYEGEPLPNTPPKAKYAALGDSYSSGKGNPLYEYGSDIPGVNECHRSPRAYPRLLQSDLSLGATAFVACSGATTANITDGQWIEPPQIDVLTDETEIITLTIGGNDVGFSDYAFSCVVACGPGTPLYNAIMAAINQPAFKDLLVYTYQEVLEAAPNAKLYVADYPYLAAEDAITCEGLDFSGAYNVQAALNEVISTAVAEVRLHNNHIFMVQTNYSTSPFAGGHLCNGGNPLFTGVILPPGDVKASLHPDIDGHVAYAEVFKQYISS